MKSSKVFLLGITALTVLSGSEPNVAARNPAKFTNIPFAVAGMCPQYDSGVSSKVVSSLGQAKIQVVSNGEGDAGFDVYCSNPSSGTLPDTATGTFAEGALTFNIAGLPTAGTLRGNVTYTDSTQSLFSVAPVSGVVTIPANNPTIPGSAVIDIKVQVTTNGGHPPFEGPPYATVTISNLHYKNAALLVDTTVTDQGPEGINFCDNI